MKKVLLTTAAVAGLSLAAYSQGNVFFNDTSAVNGSVDISTAGVLSYASGNYTVALYYMNPATTTSPAPDATGYLSVSQFNADGFTLAATTPGEANGAFDAGPAVTLGVPGGYSNGFNVSDVLALVAWTGTYSTLAQAVAANAEVGIISFVNPVGPGGSAPQVPYLTGWNNLTATPAVQAFEGSAGFPDLVMAPVPEPTTDRKSVV